MNLGLIFDEPMAQYHASAAFGVHDLDDLDPHPLLFWKKHVAKTIPPRADSPSLAFGRYFHTLALEGEEAAGAGYIEAPEGIDRRTKEGKLDWAKFQQEATGRQIITQDDRKLAWRMVEAIREKPSLCTLLDPAIGRPEVTFRHQFKHFALQCRSDWFLAKPPGGGPAMDVNVKTVESLGAFDSQFEKFGYYRGAAFYRSLMAKVLGLEPMEPQMVFLVVEKSEPFQAVLRTPDAQSLDIGFTEVHRDLSRLMGCFEKNEWPGEPDVARPVTLPAWKVKASQS